MAANCARPTIPPLLLSTPNSFQLVSCATGRFTLQTPCCSPSYVTGPHVPNSKSTLPALLRRQLSDRHIPAAVTLNCLSDTDLLLAVPLVQRGAVQRVRRGRGNPSGSRGSVTARRRCRRRRHGRCVGPADARQHTVRAGAPATRGHSRRWPPSLATGAPPV